MALNGVPRDQTVHHVRENFDLTDEQVTALLDDVYQLAQDID